MTDIDNLNKTVWATIRPSKIHGVGVFAIRNIPKGTPITSNTITCLNKQKPLYQIPEDDFNLILPEIRNLILDRILFTKNIFTFVSPNDEICLQSFMNHSDNPNSDGNIATRDILKDEEITENYRLLNGYDNIRPYSKEHNKYIFNL